MHLSTFNSHTQMHLSFKVLDSTEKPGKTRRFLDAQKMMYTDAELHFEGGLPEPCIAPFISSNYIIQYLVVHELGFLLSI